MHLSQKLTSKVSQGQNLTPHMSQSLRILEMGNLELQQALQSLVDENPLLSLDSPHQPEETEPAEPLAGDNLSFENTWTGSAISGTHMGEGDAIQRLPCADLSLRDHLSTQINMDFLCPTDRFMAFYLLDHLDSAGYLRSSLESLSSVLRVPHNHLQGIRERLMKMDPVGVFSLNLEECLAAQLKDRGLWSLPKQRLLSHLTLFAQGQFEKLKRKCGFNDQELTQAINHIRQLNPKPGLLFASHNNVTIVPDVLLQRTPSRQGWHVVLNPRTLPKVAINHTYYAEILETSPHKAAVRYMKKSFTAATWLEKALQQRCETTLKVASEIVSAQQRFFEQGVSALKPLKLSDIAQKLELHESTISRTANNKFMGTPLGTFQLRYFFTTALTSAFGEKDLSAKSVQCRIRTLIQEEDKAKPISDDNLVKVLKGEGMAVARRTVAKYRNALGIPASFYRKEWSPKK